MIYHYLTDEHGTILATYDEHDEPLARAQGLQVATSFPDSQVWFHSGEFGSSTKPDIGSSMSARLVHTGTRIMPRKYVGPALAMRSY